MKYLGVNSTGGTMWLACVSDGEVIETTPSSLVMPSGMEAGQQLVALLDDASRVLRQHSPIKVLILDPEPISKRTYAQSRPRLENETLFALAAAQQNIECVRLSRRSLRAALNLPGSGPLSELVQRVISDPTGPSWKGKRDLAALAALAGAKGSEC